MSDNEAVSWSHYNEHQRNTEQDIRYKIAQELLEHIRFLEKNNSPECFIQGVDRARNYVLYNMSINNFIDSETPQQRLF